MTMTKTSTPLLNRPTTAILDGDMIAHLTAYICDDADEMPMLLRQRIRAWTPPGMKHVFIAESDDRGNNFRRDFWPDYKAHRDKAEIDEVLEDRLLYARELLREDTMRHKFVPRMEADDLMGVAASSGKAIAVTLDKDLLSVPGWHYRPEYSHPGKVNEDGSRSRVTHEPLEIFQSPWQADLEFHKQWLTGDKTDNFGGITGIGPAKAYKWLKKFHPRDYHEACLVMYDQKGLSEDYCMAMRACARILRDVDWPYVQV